MYKLKSMNAEYYPEPHVYLPFIPKLDVAPPTSAACGLSVMELFHLFIQRWAEHRL